MNSRMKDFFDIYTLSKQYEFNRDTLAAAIKQTFENRNTELTTNPIVFTESFAKDENITRQWRAFLNRGMKGTAPDDIREVINGIQHFLNPMLFHVSSRERQ